MSAGKKPMPQLAANGDTLRQPRGEGKQKRRRRSRLAPDRGGVRPRHPAREVVAVGGHLHPSRYRSLGCKDATSAGRPDARSILMERNDLISVTASPGEDTQHDDAEREEREDLTNVHLICLYSFGAAASPSRPVPRGRSRGTGRAPMRGLVRGHAAYECQPAADGGPSVMRSAVIRAD